jgi:hypothetical protein
VLGSNSTPPPPSLASAQFSDSAAQLGVAFGSDTDQGGFTSSFPCSRILNFVRVGGSTCMWTDRRTLLITLGAGAIIVPGNNVTLLADTVGGSASGKRALLSCGSMS